MSKPRPLLRAPIIDYHQMVSFIEDKYGISTRGKPDYWHWLIDNEFYNLSNGSEQYWNMKDILDDDDLAPDWVKKITQLFYDEFKDHLDEDGGMHVLVQW